MQNLRAAIKFFEGDRKSRRTKFLHEFIKGGLFNNIKGSYDNINIRMKSNFSFRLNLWDFDLMFWIGDWINPFALHFFRRCCWWHRFRFFFERQEHLFLLFHQCLPFEARIRVNRDVGFRLVLFLSIFRSHVSDFTVNWPLSPSTVEFSKCPANPTKIKLHFL